ncbi:MAG: hypothetical protein AB1664_15170 [Thermodesulfobacteriota bacterium]
MTETLEHEERVRTLLSKWDDEIERLKAASLDAADEDRKRYDEAIELLVANREAMRRGLLVLPETEEIPRASGETEAESSREAEPVREGFFERFFHGDLEETRKQRQFYGREG